MGFPEVGKQLEVLLAGCEQVYSVDELTAKLDSSRKQNRPLRIKLGLDPTAPDIHLGHTVQLKKVRQFQDERSKTRPVLDEAEIAANAQTYFDQAGCVLDMAGDKVEIVRNSEWLSPMSAVDLIRLAGQTTVGQMLKRDDFRKRFEAEVPISMHEFLYPLVQAQDSVAIRADVELGGTDQTFNFLLAREVQRNVGQEPEVVLLLPLLVGLDGVEKMSKSLGNYVGVTESAHDMFGKLMSLSDELMANYFELLTAVSKEEISQLCDAARTHPMEAKKLLAETIAGTYHKADVVDKARQEWEQLHQKSAGAGSTLVVPEGTPTVVLEGDLMQDGRVRLLDLVMECGYAPSRSEARRLIAEKGVRLNGKVIADANELLVLQNGDVLQRGKRRFVRLEVP